MTSTFSCHFKRSLNFRPSGPCVKRHALVQFPPTILLKNLIALHTMYQARIYFSKHYLMELGIALLFLHATPSASSSAVLPHFLHATAFCPADYLASAQTLRPSPSSSLHAYPEHGPVRHSSNIVAARSWIARARRAIWRHARPFHELVERHEINNDIELNEFNDTHRLAL
jgi:hypothetical protein